MDEKRDIKIKRRKDKNAQKISHLLYMLKSQKSWAAVKRREHHLQLENDNHLDIQLQLHI